MKFKYLFVNKKETEKNVATYTQPALDLLLTDTIFDGLLSAATDATQQNYGQIKTTNFDICVRHYDFAI